MDDKHAERVLKSAPGEAEDRALESLTRRLAQVSPSPLCEPSRALFSDSPSPIWVISSLFDFTT